MSARPPGDGLFSRYRWIAGRIVGSLWFRVTLFAIAAILTVIVARLAAPLVPRALAEGIRDWGAREILSILASSMLLMATFSLGTMVAAFAAAAGTATPRATKVLIDDPLSANVVATFLGAFVFAILGLIALALGLYSREGEAVLILVAALIVVVVVATLLLWLDHLANLVRLDATIHKMDDRAQATLKARAAMPRLGGAPMAMLDAPRAVLATKVGYVQHIDLRALQRIADAADGRIAVDRLPGQLVDPSRALAQVSWAADDGEIAEIRRAFILDAERSFEQDPRYCLVTVAEIGSRALSPGINDPGTAIVVIGTLHRLLAIWAAADADTGEPRCPRVLVPDLETADLFEDAFGALLRDGAGILEVGIRLQKTLAALAAIGSEEFAEIARHLSERAMAHAEHALAVPADRERLAAVAAGVGEAAA